MKRNRTLVGSVAIGLQQQQRDVNGNGTLRFFLLFKGFLKYVDAFDRNLGASSKKGSISRE